MKKVLTILAIILTAYAKAESWKIEAVVIHDEKTNKTQKITNPTGTVFFDFVNKVITMPSQYYPGWFVFNVCEDGGSDENTVSYYLRRKDFTPFSNHYIIFNFADSAYYYGGYEGVVLIMYKGLKKTIYISRIEDERSGVEYLEYLKGKFNSITFDWYFIDNDAKGNLFFAKGEPIKEVGDDKKIKIWLKVLMKNPEKFKGAFYKNVELKFIMNFDCINKQLMSEDYYYYSSAGDLIEQQRGEYSWDYAVPETIGETLLKKICVWFGN